MNLLRYLPKNTKIDFIGARWWAFAFTGITIAASIASILLQGFNLGIDFTGGVLVEIRREQALDLGEMRNKLGTLGFGEVQLQGVTGAGGLCDNPPGSCALIRVQPREGITGQEQAVVTKIQEALGEEYEFRRTEVVGPKVSSELFTSGVIAAVLAVLIIALYVAFRFEWQFGIAAIVATGHDVFVTTGLFSILQLDFNLTAVAALLTLAGYSVNDTVVVFDRIRENKRKYKKMPLEELLNLSINQVLSRTILTSVTTAAAIIPLFLFGGEALFNFSAALLFGIVIGTYSSIYVASALLLYLPRIGGMASAKPDAPEARPAAP